MKLSFSKDGQPLIDGKAVPEAEKGVYAVNDEQGRPMFNISMKPGEVKIIVPRESGYKIIDLVLDRESLNEMANAQGGRVTRVSAEAKKEDVKVILTLDVSALKPSEIGVNKDLELKFENTPLVLVTPSAVLRPQLEVSRGYNINLSSTFDAARDQAQKLPGHEDAVVEKARLDVLYALCKVKADSSQDIGTCLAPDVRSDQYARSR